MLLLVPHYEFDKNANSINVGITMLVILISLATIGVCVFCAATSVAALFILERGEKMDYELWAEKARTAIDANVISGKKLEVKHLFPGHEWEALSRGERITFGRYFSDAVKEGKIPNIVRCEEGKNHHNQYIKKEISLI